MVRSGDRFDLVRVFEFARAHQAENPVTKQCRVQEVSTSGYYAWRDRNPSKRAREDAALAIRIRELHRRPDGTYGSPRLLDGLADELLDVSRKRAAWLMKAQGLQGVSRRRFICTTTRGSRAAAAPKLDLREFSADGPNKLWVADITYVPTWSGSLYLAVVLDVWSFRIAGRATGTRLRTELVVEALEMALERRKPQDVIHHSDQGSQYTSIEFGRRGRDANVRPSMGTVGDSFDNAMCESFFAMLGCELLDRKTFRTQVEDRMAVFCFIEGLCNSRRRHSAIGNLCPMRFEARHSDSNSAAELDGTPRFRGTEGLLEPLRGSRTSPQPVV